MKKIVYFFILIFVFSVLIIFLIFLNINNILNTSFLKNNLSAFLLKRYNITLQYNDAKFSFKEKGLYFKEFHLATPSFDANIKDVYLTLNFKKIFYWENPIKEVYINTGAFTYFYDQKTKKEKKNFVNIFKKLSKILKSQAFYVRIANLNLYIQGLSNQNKNKLNIGVISGNYNLDNTHLVFETKISDSDIVKDVFLKARIDFLNNFFEGLFYIKGLNATYIPWFEKTSSFSDIDIHGTAILEKDRVDFLILGKNSNFPFFKAKGYYFDNFLKISLEYQSLERAKRRIDLELNKNEKGIYNFILKAEEFSIKEALPIIKVFLPEKYILYFQAAKEGLVSDFVFKAESPCLSTLFSFSDIFLKGKIKKGNYILPIFGNIPISDFEGDVIVENKHFRISGNGKISEVGEFLNGTLELSKDKNLFDIRLRFIGEGDAEKIKKFVVKHWKVLSILDKYKLKDKAKFSFHLKYNSPTSFYLDIKSFFPVRVKSSSFQNWFELKGVNLNYKPNILSISIENIFYSKNRAKNVIAVLDFSKKETSFTIEEIYIYSKDFLEKLTHFAHFKKVEFYNFSKLSLKNITYQGPFLLNKEFIDKRKLNFKGEVKDLLVEFKQKVLKSEVLRFEKKKDFINFFSPEIEIQRSIFEIKGLYDWKVKEIKLKGKGIISKKDFSYFKTDILVKSFEFFYKEKEGQIEGKSECEIKNLQSFIFVKGTLSEFLIYSKFVNENMNLNLKIRKKENNKENKVVIKGKLALKEVQDLFPYIITGWIDSDITLIFNFSFKKLINFLKTKDYKTLFEKTKTFGKVNFKEVQLNFWKNKIFEGRIDITPYEIKIKPLVVKNKNYPITANLIIKKRKKDYFLIGSVNGELKLSYFPGLKKNKTKKSKSFFLLSLIRTAPISGRLYINLSKVILPSYHQIKDIKMLISFYKDGSYFVELKKAIICGVKINGYLSYFPDYKYLFIKTLPFSSDLLELSSCLSFTEIPKVLLEGSFTCEGFFYSDGEKNLWENVYGEIKINSSEGYIYRMPILLKILGYLSPIDIFKGKIPDLRKKFLEYDTLEFSGILTKKYCKLKKLFISAPGFRLFTEGKIYYPWENGKIELDVYASPFKTADVLLEKIPLVRGLLGETKMLVFIPLKIEGTYQKIKIVPLHPESIGKGGSRIFLKILRFLKIYPPQEAR